MDGFSLLTWILGLTVLYGCWLLAVSLHNDPAVDESYDRVDRDIDARNAHDARMRREARI